MVQRKQRGDAERPWRVLPSPQPRLVRLITLDERPLFVPALLAPEEVPGVLGVELHLLTRAVRQWAEEGVAGSRRRASLEVAKRRAEVLSEAPSRLRHSLQALFRIRTPHSPDIAEVQTACLTISEWAQEAGFPATAVELAEACAAAIPEPSIWFAQVGADESLLAAAAWGSFVAARTNRIAGEAWRAEVFYTRAIQFAIWAATAAVEHANRADRKRARTIYVRASLGLGRLHAKGGRYRAAARRYRAAARVAYELGEEWLSAQTCHDLLALSLEEALLSGIGARARPDFARARRYGRLALQRYPKHNERFPAAVHDFVFLLVCEHRYREARPLLDLLMQAPIPVHDQVIGWSTLARTAAALGDGGRYADAEARVLELSPHYPLHAAAAFVNLAFGARALGDWELAAHYASRGIALAEADGDRLVAQVGHTLHGEIDARVPAASPAAPLQGRDAQVLLDLSAAIADQLAAWRGPTWTKKENQFGTSSLGLV